MYSVTDPDFLCTSNKVGTGGCGLYMELLGHCMHSVTDPDFCAPVFLLEIIGVHLTMYGAVYIKTILSDRSSPCLWFTLQPNDVRSMEQLSKTFKALKIACSDLLNYYLQIPENVRYPCYQKFCGRNETDFELLYKDELVNQVFVAKSSMDQLVIVKFLEDCGVDVHQECAKMWYCTPAVLL